MRRARSCSILAALLAVGALGVLCAGSLLFWFAAPLPGNLRLTRILGTQIKAGQCLGPRSLAQPGWTLEFAREFLTPDDPVKLIADYGRRGWEVIAFSNRVGFDLLPRDPQRLDLYVVHLEVHEGVTLSVVDDESTQIHWDYALTVCPS